MVGYYWDEFVRTASGWQMCGLTELLYWNEGNSFVRDDNFVGTAEVPRRADVP